MQGIKVLRIMKRPKIYIHVRSKWGKNEKTVLMMHLSNVGKMKSRKNKPFWRVYIIPRWLA